MHFDGHRLNKMIYAGLYRSHFGDHETTRLINNIWKVADVALQRYHDAPTKASGDFNAHYQKWLFPYQITDHAGREVYKLL